MKIAINGMGRIGRAALKIINETEQLEVVAVNDLVSLDNITYLLKYDSVYGIYEKKVTHSENELIVDGKSIKFFNERNPEDLPWAELGIDVVIESTGVFTKSEDLERHLKAGAKTVVLSAPTKSTNTPTIVHGVNNHSDNNQFFSCASCTTNNISPIMEILGRRLGVEKAIMTTIHAYTASQDLVDSPSKNNFRLGRAGAANIIPTTTGAAIATTLVLPEFQNKFDGVAVRVPIPVGSLSDITIVLSKKTSAEVVNEILKEEAATNRYKEVLAVTNEPIVSSDIVKNPYASTVDLSMTKVVDGDLLKIMTWYDNEWGFTNQMIRQILEMK
ncbi:MAG: type I glyceraldehyde-3-phosphate dehydrogenase [Gelidibacter sp.]|nr:type I glyceraldehyde-3-phosphate dehydrogenase [Gelidibacter sp.]